MSAKESNETALAPADLSKKRLSPGSDIPKNVGISDSLPVIAGLPPIDPGAGRRLSGDQLEQSWSQNRRGKAFLNKGEYLDAQVAFLDGVKINPGNLRMRYNLAAAYSLNGQLPEAEAIIRQFADATDCLRCALSLSEVGEDESFSAIMKTASVSQIVDGAAEDVNRQLDAADWIKPDKASFKKNTPRFFFRGLPAVSNGGFRIAAPLVGHTQKGGRTYTLHILDPRIGTLVSQRLLTPAEADRVKAGKASIPALNKMLDARLEEVNSMMLGWNWRSMETLAYELNMDMEYGDPQDFEAGKFNIRFADEVITILDQQGTEIYQGATDWYKGAGAPNCDYHTAISSVHGSVDEPQTLLFFISYQIKDGCDRPASVWRALRIPTRANGFGGAAITRVYTEEPRYQAVYYDTANAKRKVLIQSPNWVYTVMDRSSDNTWVLLSRMSSDPARAKGVSETFLLFHVPTGRQVATNHAYFQQVQKDKAFCNKGCRYLNIEQKSGADKVVMLVGGVEVAFPLAPLAVSVSAAI